MHKYIIYLRFIYIMDIRPELIILIILVAFGIAYFVMQQTRQTSCPSCTSTPVHEKIETPIVDEPPRRNNVSRRDNISGFDMGFGSGGAPIGMVFDPLRDFDRRAFSDPLAPPRKRNLHEPDYLNPTLAPIYTQGAPSPYRKVGTLKAVTAIDGSDDTLDSTAKYQFLYLMASKINSNQFNYYVTSTNTQDSIKFELTKKTEIYDGDYVTISMLDDQGYKVIMDENALPLLIGIA